MLVAWILCAIRKVSLRVARGALAGVGRGGGWVCHRLGGGGIEAPPFPTPLPRGDLASGIPHSPRRRGIWPPAFPTLLAGGALATTGKKLTERLEAPCVFLYTGPPLCKQACNGLSGYKKSPQALLESFFPLLR